MPWGTAGWASRWLHRRVHTQPYAPPRHGTHKAHETPCAGVSLGDPITCGLASTSRRNGGWVCSELEMAEDFANHFALRDDGDEPQCPALAPGTRAHLQGKHALQESGPRPVRGAPRHLLPVQPLLAWRR